MNPESSLQERISVANEVDAACRLYGFFYLNGHGISEDETRAIRDIASTFFSLPQEEKEKYSIENIDFARGYQRLGQNITKYARDWHEAVDLFPEVGPDHIIRKRGLKTLSGKNPSVSYPPNFNKVVDEYVEKMKIVGKYTMRAVALGLGLEERFFEQFQDNSFWILRLIGYPPLSSKSFQDEGISCGEHCDYGCLTILNTDETRGALQVKSKSGDWIDADPVPGAFVINIGDMLSVWTNGLYASTPHRVIHRGARSRISAPFFFEPNFDAVVEPLERCVRDSGRPPLRRPVMYGDHLLAKVGGNFDVAPPAAPPGHG